jgi:hypothetical protein
MWIVMLSVVEWEHFTNDQKELHHTMRESLLSSYNKASHTVLQHWLWRFLKQQTERRPSQAQDHAAPHGRRQAASDYVLF